MRTRHSFTAIAACIAAASLSLAACGGPSSEVAQADAVVTNPVEVFTWWANGSEKAGLDALVGALNEQHPETTFVNGAIGGGAGSAAKDLLKTRLESQNPPDTFQAHAGAELADYIDAGQVQDI